MCDLQVNIAAGAKRLRLLIKGCGLAPVVKVSPEVLHFGIVPTYQWADQLVQVSSGCSRLPVKLAVTPSGPYFSALPALVELQPGGGAEVCLRYRPKVSHGRCVAAQS